MTPAPGAVRVATWWRGRPSGADLHYGVQLAAAVVVAYLASSLLGLPENFWAVMSALIIVRRNSDLTLGAGWDRARGTVVGTLVGLAGVGLRHIGAPAVPTTLGIVALLAFASALLPILRSAPITALIVVGSGSMAGHSSLQVAGLRVAEIGIGVVAGLAMSMLLSSSRAAHRFDVACAAVLRRIGRELDLGFEPGQPLPADKEARVVAGREELRRLSLLAASADRELRWSARSTPGGALAAGTSPVARRRPERCRHIARLVTRIAQDAALPGRLFEALPDCRGDALWPALRSAAGQALAASADAFEGGPPPDLIGLRRVVVGVPADGVPASAAHAALVGPVHLLAHDLGLLERLRQRDPRP
jgi:hypothetical protein